jgi:hypothetical protein
MDLRKGEILIVTSRGDASPSIVRYHESPAVTREGLRERLEREKARGLRYAQAWIEQPGSHDPLHPSWRKYLVLNPVLEPNAERSLDPALIQEERQASPRAAAL